MIDRLGGGRMALGWTVTGTAGGEPFSLTRNNRFADSSDISFASTDEMFGYLATIVQNPFTEVKLNTIDITAAVQSQFRQYLIKGLEHFDGTTWVPVTSTDTITLTPGETLRVRVLLENYRSSTPVAPSNSRSRSPTTRRATARSTSRAAPTAAATRAADRAAAPPTPARRRSRTS